MHALEHRSERLEVVATILLGAATVASAWCTYQSELWNSHQLESMAGASVADNESVRATDIASRDAIVDVGTFTSLLQAEARDDQRAVAIIRTRARPAFRPALDAWYARRHGREPAPGTPFEDPQYRAKMDSVSSSQRQQALALLREANFANANSDRFVMRTVALATALFFLGLGGQFRAASMRRLSVFLGAVVLVLALVSVARLPLAPRPSRFASEQERAPT